MGPVFGSAQESLVLSHGSRGLPLAKSPSTWSPVWVQLTRRAVVWVSTISITSSLPPPRAQGTVMSLLAVVVFTEKLTWLPMAMAPVFLSGVHTGPGQPTTPVQSGSRQSMRPSLSSSMPLVQSSGPRVL